MVTVFVRLRDDADCDDANISSYFMKTPRALLELPSMSGITARADFGQNACKTVFLKFSDRSTPETSPSRVGRREESSGVQVMPGIAQGKQAQITQCRAEIAQIEELA